MCGGTRFHETTARIIERSLRYTGLPSRHARSAVRWTKRESLRRERHDETSPCACAGDGPFTAGDAALSGAKRNEKNRVRRPRGRQAEPRPDHPIGKRSVRKTFALSSRRNPPRRRRRSRRWLGSALSPPLWEPVRSHHISVSPACRATRRILSSHVRLVNGIETAHRTRRQLTATILRGGAGRPTRARAPVAADGIRNVLTSVVCVHHNPMLGWRPSSPAAARRAEPGRSA